MKQEHGLGGFFLSSPVSLHDSPSASFFNNDDDEDAHTHIEYRQKNKYSK